MATERIGVLLWRYSIPSIVGMVVNALYSVVDRLYIGLGVGVEAMAGMTLAMPYMQVMAAFGMLIGIGSGALVSLRLGQGRDDEAEKVLGQALALIGLMVLIIPSIAMPTLNIALRYFGGTEEAIPHARAYLRIILYGSFFTHVSFGMNHIMRAEGSAKRAMQAMVLGAVANIILDPIFIFTFKMGIRGAAVATIFSMMLSSAYALLHFSGPHARVRLKLSNIRIYPRLAASALSIGLSPFSLQLVASVVMVLYTRSFKIYAQSDAETMDTIAAIGIINAIFMMLLMPIFGLNGGVQPILGFNYGAQKFKRVRAAFLLAAKVATAVSVAGWLIVLVGAFWLIRAFTSSETLLALAPPALRTMSLALPVVGISVITTTYFQSIGKPAFAILLSLLRQTIFLIPMIVALPLIFGLKGIWAAAPLSDLLTACVVIPLMTREMRRLWLRKAEPPPPRR